MSRSLLADIRRMPLVLYAYAFAFSACTADPTTAPQGPPTPSATTHVVPARIDATGSQDVSVPLQAWLDSLPDNSRIVGPAGARYRVEFGLNIENRRAIQLDAADSRNPPTLFQTQLEPYGPGDSRNRNREVLAFRRGGGHALRNWILQGGQPNSGVNFPFIEALEAQHGLVVAGVDGMLVEDVFITELAGDFIYLANVGVQGVVFNNRDITIRRTKGRKASRQGIGIAGTTNTLIENSDFQDIKRSAFDIEPNGPALGTVQNVVVRNNIFGFFDNHWVAGQGASAATVGDLLFENNEVIGRILKFEIIGWRTTAPAPARNRRFNIRVINNRAHSMPAVVSTDLVVMGFHAIDGVEVVGNVVDYNGDKPIGVGAWFNESCGITYADNTWGNARYGHKVTVGYDTVPVEIAAAGAALYATLVPVVPLSASIPNGKKVLFSGERFFETHEGAALPGASTVTVKPLRATLNAGEQGEYTEPITEYDGPNLEWAGCGALLRTSR